jgi:NAD(P)-dependent dehydrogenase (short-subunit alcohol dehydrogenase family)
MALILVTGASSGLGRNTAHALVDDGHHVVVQVRNPARLTAADGGARWKGMIVGDLADLEEIRGVARQAAEFGRFAVIHNAGTGGARRNRRLCPGRARMRRSPELVGDDWFEREARAASWVNAKDVDPSMNPGRNPSP